MLFSFLAGEVLEKSCTSSSKNTCQVQPDFKFKLMSSQNDVKCNARNIYCNYYHVGLQGEVGQEGDEEVQEG